MTEINQNFSLFVRNDMDVNFDIGPDDTGTNLEFAEVLTWKAYPQILGVPTMTAALISKAPGAGMIITDPLLMHLTIELLSADTTGMAGNYYHEIMLTANHGKVTTLATGLMTVIDPSHVPNVDAFKAMFPEFEDVDDTTVQIALDQAGQFVDATWGGSQTAGQMYLAAHFMILGQAPADSGVGRVITSESIGRISVSYAVDSGAVGGGGDGQLSSTTYGLVFNNMLTQQGFGIAIC
jgi:Protein of unknown function (DUF4054)